MKKLTMIMIAVLLIAIPASVFAGDGIWVGPTALYSTGMTFGELSTEGLEGYEFDASDFNYGVEARLDISIFQGSVNAVYHADTIFGDILETNLNAGLYADLGIVGLGLSAGPKYIVLLEEGYEEAVEWGSNLKVAADLILGSTILSAYFSADIYDLETWAETADFESLYGRAGLSLLFQL
ncbi:MAG: hypothetical protein K9M84_08360 [Spirochaetia bacterium]|nr:hypothetical protein [Spirochaetia bacterium]MCF7941612.1 hypothetical protein [Spirochaetia bacterium]